MKKRRAANERFVLVAAAVLFVKKNQRQRVCRRAGERARDLGAGFRVMSGCRLIRIESSTVDKRYVYDIFLTTMPTYFNKIYMSSSPTFYELILGHKSFSGLFSKPVVFIYFLKQWSTHLENVWPFSCCINLSELAGFSPTPLPSVWDEAETSKFYN